MKAVRLALVSGLFLTLAALPLQAQKDKAPKKDDKAAAVSKDKLVGTWEVTEPGTAGEKGVVYEFTKDKVTISSKGKKGLSGTFKLDGDKITWKVGTAGVAAESPPMTITKLTDKELVFEDPAGAKTVLKKK